MTNGQAIKILTNALQSDESKYTAEIDKALSIVQRVFAKIPEKHGRLIDADKLLEAEDKDYIGSMIEAKKAGDPIRTTILKTVHQAIEMFVNEQPVIVERSESE